MPCYHPIPARQDVPGGPVTLQPQLGTANLALPCGKCIGCRTARATQWANRCSHEASLWEHNVFLTLTYADENLPPEGHLQPAHFRNFLKRLRIHAHRDGGSLNRDRRSSIRFFACGEYGSTTQRPHYHALLFNCGFRDTSRVGKELYESELLTRLWPHGQHKLGEATPAAANYIAQYSLKKQSGNTGEIDPDGVWRPAPFLRMSLRPAIGNEWLKKYHSDLEMGYLVANAKRTEIPRYYHKKLQQLQTHLWEEIDYRKQKHRLENPTDNTQPERLAAAEIIHKRRKELTENRRL